MRHHANHKDPGIPCENYENDGNLRKSYENHACHENLWIPCENHENQEHLGNSRENFENHENLIIFTRESRKFLKY